MDEHPCTRACACNFGIRLQRASFVSKQYKLQLGSSADHGAHPRPELSCRGTPWPALVCILTVPTWSFPKAPHGAWGRTPWYERFELIAWNPLLFPDQPVGCSACLTVGGAALPLLARNHTGIGCRHPLTISSVAARASGGNEDRNTSRDSNDPVWGWLSVPASRHASCQTAAFICISNGMVLLRVLATWSLTQTLQSSKEPIEFGHTRKDVVLIGVGLIGVGYAMYYGLQVSVPACTARGWEPTGTHVPSCTPSPCVPALMPGHHLDYTGSGSGRRLSRELGAALCLPGHLRVLDWVIHLARWHQGGLAVGGLHCMQ